MQPEKFTQKSQEALAEAQRLAREHSHQGIDGEHLALALIGQTVRSVRTEVKAVTV